MFGLGVNRLGVTNQATIFTPASLFNNGEAGVWYDPSAASGSLDWRKNLLEYTESFDNSYWAKENTSISSNQTAAPDGTNTADKVEEQNTNNTFHFVNHAISLGAGVKTFSAYFKADERSFAGLTLRVNGGNVRLAVLFNLTNGTVSDTITMGSPTQTSSSIQDVGNGWYRCSVSAYHSTGSVIFLISPHNDGTSSAINMDYAGIVGHGVYAWGAQVEEASTASSYQPILSTFENAFKTAFPSHTLYQDYQGETPVTAVGEPVGLMLDKSKGLAQGPEQVTNGDFATDSGWSKGPGWTISGGKATQSGGTGDLSQTITTVAGRSYLLSSEITDYVSGQLDVEAFPLTNRLWKDAAGYYSVIFVADSSSTTILANPRNSAPFIGSIDNVSVTEIQGSHATQPTSTKRPIYARHPEGGIRNLLNYTEQFDNGYWQKLRGDVTPFESPIGDTSAFKFQQFSGQTIVPVIRANVPVITGKVYTFSAFVKKGTRDSFSLHEQATANGIDSYFNILNGTVSNQGSGHIARIQDAGNGWYRCSITYTAAFSASKTHDLRIGVIETTAVPDDQGFTYLWGAQLEEAAEASNYQKRVTDIDVTESGVGEVYYLKFDGVDDGMSINSLTSASTPLTAFFGYSATNAEATANTLLVDIETGRTFLAASAVTAGKIGYYDGAYSEFEADSNVLKVLTYDLVENDAKIRIDGTQEYSDTTYDERAIGGDVGLFSNFPVTSNEVAGNMYQTILRAAESTDEEIAKAETYVANKTGLKAQVDGIATLDLNFGNNTYTAKNSNGGVI